MGVRVRAALRLICAISILSGAAWAQLARYDGFVAPAGYANGPANVVVCSATGSGGPPCSPQALIYSDVTGKYQISQPFSADINGRYYFYAAPNTYAVQTYGTGYTTTLKTVTIGAAGSSQNVTNLNGGTYSAIANGLKCDGATDDTAALQALDQAIYNAGGGTVAFPAATCLISSQITLPNSNGGTSGANAGTMPPIRWTGQNPGMNSYNGTGGAPVGGSILNLTFNAGTAKILTVGAGYFEIDHLTLEDTSTDCAAFVFDSNTVMHVHDSEVYGSTAGASACNDVFLLGTASGTISGNLNAPFQGYGTVIKDNFFDKIKRMVFGQTFANAITIRDNTVWQNAGYTTGGAIEFNGCGATCSGESGGNSIGNVIEGNLLEVVNYKYGVHLFGFSQQMYVAANSCYDPGGSYLHCVQLDTNADFNMVIAGFSPDASGTYFSDVDKASNYLTMHQNVATVFSQPVKSINGNNVSFQVTGASGNVANAYDILNTTTNDEVFQQLSSSSGVQWTLNWKPAGGAAEVPLSVLRASSTTLSITVGTSSDTQVQFDTGAADLKVGTQGAGNVLWLCGGSFNCAQYVDAAGTYRAFHLGQNGTHDVAGTCTAAAATTCTVTFGTAYGNAPVCTATDQTNITTVKVTPSTTQLVITTSASSSDVFAYHCIGNPN